MITKGQSTLIKGICKIQIESLNRVLCTTDLEVENQELLDNLGSSRKEFDSTLLNIKNKFHKLMDNPEELQNLSYEELMVMLYITQNLHNLEVELSSKLPNARKNLTRKLVMLSSVSEFSS